MKLARKIGNPLSLKLNVNSPCVLVPAPIVVPITTMDAPGRGVPFSSNTTPLKHRVVALSFSLFS